MADLELLSLDKLTPQHIAPTSADRGVVVSGSLLSKVPDGASAVGWTFDTGNLTTAGAKLLSLKNNGLEKFSIDKDGVLSSDPAINIVINSLSDFAVQDATTITLEAFKTYIPGAPIITSKRFIIQPGVSIIGSNLVGHIWESTTTGSMFTVVDAILLNVQNFAFKCTTGVGWDCTDVSEASTINFRDMISIDLAGGISADKFAKFTNVDSVVMNNIAGIEVNDGISFEGTTADFILLRDVSFDGINDIDFVAVNFNSVVVNNFLSLRGVQAEGTDIATVGISGLPNSGNVGPDIVGKIIECEFTGTITPLSGISRSDLRWEVKDSSPIPNSTKTVDAFLTTPETVTITDAGVFVPIGGTNWSSDVSERFSVSTAGLITSLSPSSSEVQVLISATVEKVGGGSDEIELAVAINGTASMKTIGATKNSTFTTITAVGIFTVAENTTIQAFVANVDSSSNILVDHCSMTVINGF